MFVEGLGPLLPGAVGPERMERFRGYAKAILAQDEAQQPKALRGVRSDLERVLAWWMPALSSAEALARMPGGRPQGARGLEPAAPHRSRRSRQLDLPALFGPYLEEGQTRVMFELGRLELQPSELASLDERMFDGVVKRKVAEWQLNQWLQTTRRGGWPEARPFVEKGLRRGPPVSDACRAHVAPGAARAPGLRRGRPPARRHRHRTRRRLRPHPIRPPVGAGFHPRPELGLCNAPAPACGIPSPPAPDAGCEHRTQVASTPLARTVAWMAAKKKTRSAPKARKSKTPARKRAKKGSKPAVKPAKRGKAKPAPKAQARRKPAAKPKAVPKPKPAPEPQAQGHAATSKPKQRTTTQTRGVADVAVSPQRRRARATLLHQ